jgi:predicted GH43/DUF377 family glycosyl hydrolase
VAKSRFEAVVAVLALLAIAYAPSASNIYPYKGPDPYDFDGVATSRPSDDTGTARKSATAGPSLASFNETSEITNLTLSIDEGMLLRHLEPLVAMKSRFTYHPQSLRTAEYIYGAFQDCGMQVEYDDWSVGTLQHRNVIATLPGEEPSAPKYYIGAHYDSISNMPYYDAPGADDDGTGTAAVLVAAETLSNYRFNSTIVFCAFSGEEQGMLGSKAFAKELNVTNPTVGGAICLDMIGYNPEPGVKDILVRANAASMDMARFIHNVSEKYPHLVINGSARLNATQNSDHSSFWPYGWDAVLLIEKKMEPNSNPNYHKTTDTIGYLNMTYAANATQLAVASVAELAGLVAGDSAGPAFRRAAPKPGGYCNETPTISVDALDPSGIDAGTVKLYIDSSETDCTVAPIPGGVGITRWLSTPFLDGHPIACRVEAQDSRGNPRTFWWNATVDATGPDAPLDLGIGLADVGAAKKGLAMNVGPSGSFDDAGTINPCVMLDGGLYKMWYGAYDGSIYRIAYATSTDGTNWTKYGVVLPNGAAGQPDSRHAADCTVQKEAGAYKMWYSANNGSCWRIMHANSTDGINWTKLGVALDLGPAGSLDDAQTLNPSVIKIGGEYRLYYAGSDGVVYRVLLATSLDGASWTRRGVAIDIGALGDKDSVIAQGPDVVQLGGGFACFYAGFDGIRTRTMLARSPDGYNWSKYGVSLDTATSSDYDYTAATHPCVIAHNGTLKIWYAGLKDYYRILHASLTEPWDGMASDAVELSWGHPGGEIERFEVYVAQSWGECLSPPEQGWMVAQSVWFVHNMAGAGNGTTYYYAVRAVDKVGHSKIAWQRAVKTAVTVPGGWAPLGVLNPSVREIGDAFSTVEWTGLQAWNASDASNHWRTNFTQRAWGLNDLTELWPMAGCWVRIPAAGVHVAVCVASNASLPLHQGWNLVSYPYMEPRSCAIIKAETGATVVEGFDELAQYRVSTLAEAEAMRPGLAYWLYLPEATVWVAENY